MERGSRGKVGVIRDNEVVVGRGAGGVLDWEPRRTKTPDRRRSVVDRSGSDGSAETSVRWKSTF